MRSFATSFMILACDKDGTALGIVADANKTIPDVEETDSASAPWRNMAHVMPEGRGAATLEQSGSE
jgi:hypothetical protein